MTNAQKLAQIFPEGIGMSADWFNDEYHGDTDSLDEVVTRRGVSEWLNMWEGYLDGDIIARMVCRVKDIPKANFDGKVAPVPTMVCHKTPQVNQDVLVYYRGAPYIAWIDSDGDWKTDYFTFDNDEVPTEYYELPQ